MLGSDEAPIDERPKGQQGRGAEAGDALPVVSDRESFAARLTDLVRTARTNGTSIDGRWTIPPYEVVISGQQVTVCRADESGSDADGHASNR